ncbi:MAG: chemotaxis protein CheW [Mariprofundaceae bacterium]|nr:chemotaxis protein CheW [Mariprofundaceae bacterium]
MEEDETVTASADAEELPVESPEQEELMKVAMNGEVYLVPVQDVAEILRPLKLTPVPMAPDHLLGVTNIRGQIVCIVDPGKVLHLKSERGALTAASRFLILRHPRMHLGIWVDETAMLYRVARSSVPEVEKDNHTHLRGEIEIDGEIFQLLNTRVFFE